MKIYVINGPNLNLLGSREPQLYGNSSFETYFETLKTMFSEVELTYIQSNSECELINAIHEAGINNAGIVINAGAYTHTSLAIADALRSVTVPAIEVHVSQVFARESYRHVSKISASCVGSISGLGLTGYKAAIDFLMHSMQ